MESIQHHLESLLGDWRRQRKLSVWSVVITVFGDAIVPRGGVVSVTSLLEIFDGLGIEANALRTALSRLASDGWINRIKHGRQSSYALAPGGEALFASATERIYAATQPRWAGTLDVVLLPPDALAASEVRSDVERRLAEYGYGSPMPGVYVYPAFAEQNTPELPDGVVRLSSSKISTKEAQRLAMLAWPLEELSKQYERFITRYLPLLNALQKKQVVDPAVAMAIRTLVIHDWRRIVLKDPDLPLELRPSPWPGTEARSIISDIYRMTLEPSERFLDQCLVTPDQTLPSPATEVSIRFIELSNITKNI